MTAVDDDGDQTVGGGEHNDHQITVVGDDGDQTIGTGNMIPLTPRWRATTVIIPSARETQ